MDDNYNVDAEWERFMNCDDDSDNATEILEHNNYNNTNNYNNSNNNNPVHFNSDCPCASDIYISTKSIISFLNKEIDLFTIFWKIPIINYNNPSNGVIKKQMKFNSTTEDQLNKIEERLKNEQYYTTQIISSINNPSGRIKFKDIRKINIGICMKDIMSYRSKQKGAFYNCFVMILRILIDNSYKEYHVKIFNTGKIEIPGVQNDNIHHIILNEVINVLRPLTCDSLDYQGEHETILINSNFNCGFYINREKLYDILNMKYNIQSIFDPCTYPGIQCKFYYDTSKILQNGIVPDDLNNINIHKLSFMVFRTGSILIVGRCSENILRKVYLFIKELLMNEFVNIHQRIIDDENNSICCKDRKNKIRKKTIMVPIYNP